MVGPLSGINALGNIAKKMGGSGAAKVKDISVSIGAADLVSGYVARNLDSVSKTPFGIRNKAVRRKELTLTSAGKPSIFSGGRAAVDTVKSYEHTQTVKIIRRNVVRGDKQERTYNVTDREFDLMVQDLKGWMESMGDFTESDPDSVEHQFDFQVL